MEKISAQSIRDMQHDVRQIKAALAALLDIESNKMDKYYYDKCFVDKIKSYKNEIDSIKTNLIAGGNETR